MIQYILNFADKCFADRESKSMINMNGGCCVGKDEVGGYHRGWARKEGVLHKTKTGALTRDSK